MNKQTKIELFHQIVNEMANLYAKKNENYGDSFGKLYGDLGPIAGLVPLHNKLDRITNLIKGGINNFESLEDSFKDLACYAIMNLIEMQEKENKKDTAELNDSLDTMIQINDNTVDLNYHTDTHNSLDTKTVLLSNCVKFDSETSHYNNKNLNFINKPKESK